MTEAVVLKKFDDVRSYFSGDRFVSGIKAVAPKHMTAERIIRLALAEVRRNPKLLDCTRESLMAAVLDASQLGLEPSSVLGTAYLVPYLNRKRGAYEAKLIPGYQGLIELARRSGAVLSIEGRVVYEGDFFEYQYGTDSWAKHVPKGGGMYLDAATGEYRPKRLTYAYAVAHIRDGRPQFVVMEKPDIDAIRARSRAPAGGPWDTDYPQMARKSPIRQLAKDIPKSPELAHALEIEDQAEGLVDFGDFIDVESPNGSVGVDQETLTEQLDGRLPADIHPGGTPEPPRSRTEDVKQQLAQRRTRADRAQRSAPVYASKDQVDDLMQMAHDRGPDAVQALEQMFAHTAPDKVTLGQLQTAKEHLMSRPVVQILPDDDGFGSVEYYGPDRDVDPMPREDE